MTSPDIAYDNTYMENSSRHDSTPVWHQAQSVPITAESSPVEGSIYWDGTNLQVYEGGAFQATSGDVSSVNGKTGAVTLKETNIPQVVATKTANYTAVSGDGILLMDATAGNLTLTLPSAVGWTTALCIVASNTNTKQTTVQTTGGQAISANGTSVVLGTTASNAPYSSIILVSDGSNWWII